jgi:hypothetical protein
VGNSAQERTERRSETEGDFQGRRKEMQDDKKGKVGVRAMGQKMKVAQQKRSTSASVCAALSISY